MEIIGIAFDIIVMILFALGWSVAGYSVYENDELQKENEALRNGNFSFNIDEEYAEEALELFRKLKALEKKEAKNDGTD